MKRLWACFFSLACPLLFGQAIPYNSEFMINNDPDQSHYCPCVIALPKNRFAVCWDGGGIFGQLFTSFGVKENGPFTIHSGTSTDQDNPTGTALPDGNFMVCWQGNPVNIYGQIFDASGLKKGSAFIVNDSRYTETPNHNFYAVVLADPQGGARFFWHNYDLTRSHWRVYGRWLRNNGTKEGNEFLVRPDGTGDQRDPTAAVFPDGKFAVCWSESGPSGDNDVYGQWFEPSGRRKGDPFRVNTTTENEQWWPKAAALDDGNLLVSWESGQPDRFSVDVFGQIFGPSGEKKGPEFRINSYVKSWQGRQGIAPMGSGRFFVIWQSMSQDGSDWGVYGKVFLNDGNKAFGEFRINDRTTGLQYCPTAARVGENRLMVCWSSQRQYGVGYSIVGKLFPLQPMVHVLVPFRLVAPTTDETLKTVSTVFYWRRAHHSEKNYPFEVTYDLLLDTDPAFIHPQVVANLSDTTTTLNDLKAGNTYFWKVLARNFSGDSLWSSDMNGFFINHNASRVPGDGKEVPRQSGFFQNYPNPFNPETSIRFELPISGTVDISIYDITGKLIKQLIKESRTAGSHSVKWDGKDSAGNPVPSGIYICRMETEGVDRKRLVMYVKMGLVK